MEPSAIRFSSIIDAEGLLYKRYAPGTELLLGQDECAAVLVGGDCRLHMPPPGQCFVCPEEGDSFAVNCRETTVEFGFHDLGDFTLSNVPGRRFRIGFYGSLSLRVIHVGGLSRLMRSREEATFVMLLNRLPADMTGRVRQMVTELLGPLPDYFDMQRKQQELEQALENLFFRYLYECGLLLRLGSLKINGFAQPYMDHS